MLKFPALKQTMFRHEKNYVFKTAKFLFQKKFPRKECANQQKKLQKIDILRSINVPSLHMLMTIIQFVLSS